MKEVGALRQHCGRPAVSAAVVLCAAVVSVALANAALTGQWVLGPAFWGSHNPMPLRPKQPSRASDAQLAKWRQFAASRQCSLHDADYSQIFSDLDPFRRAGGISEAEVLAAAAALPAATAVLEVRGGRMVEEARPRRLPWGGLGFYRQLAADFEADLPDMKLLFNFGDRPRSWAAPLPAADDAALRAGSLGVQQAWERHGCDAAVGTGMRGRHGLFQPGRFWGARGPLPVLSGWRVEGCFSDILVPHAWNNKGNVSRTTLSSGCPLSTVPWTDKSDVAFWRGSSTGAHVNSSTPPEAWSGFQRQRLVGLSRQHPTLLDAAFTRYTQCDPAACAAMEEAYGVAPFAPPSQLFSHKYTLVVDGNGAAARLGPTLCSGSVAMNAQLFREWFFFRLLPFKHYVPIRADYSDLLDRIRWARQHDREAQQIAAAAVRFVNAQLRTEDMQCYLYRLLLEYGAIYRPGRTGGGGGSGASDGGSGSGGGAARGRLAPGERPP